MMKEKPPVSYTKNVGFFTTLFFVYFGVMLLMSSLHYALVTLIQTNEWSVFWGVNIPLIYWAVLAVGLTSFTRREIRKTYERPMQQMAKATKQVASGDFSVYVKPLHTSDKQDYLDVMITDFNKMVEELGSVETLKTEFFSNVSHEIKTPLSVIQNNAELLRGEELSEKGREYTETIFRTSKRLADLIQNILKLNKLENQNITLSAEPYDLCAQLAECALAYEEIWEEQDLEVEAEIEDSCQIYADSALMEIVWNNLFSNAVKFTPPGGKITIKQWTERDAVKVAVSDTGCGMTEDTMRHIFEKFYQGDTSHAMAGNGLGLALAFRVLQLHGYEINVQSEIEKGSAFTVTIPLSSEKGAKKA